MASGASPPRGADAGVEPAEAVEGVLISTGGLEAVGNSWRIGQLMKNNAAAPTAATMAAKGKTIRLIDVAPMEIICLAMPWIKRRSIEITLRPFVSRIKPSKGVSLQLWSYCVSWSLVAAPAGSSETG